MMKTAFRCVQIVLLFYGVFGADEDEVKAVSVMEGDSVTLPTDLTQKQTINLIEWRFGDSDIAKTGENDIIYPSYTEIFRGRLQLDQTGSLTIKNMKTKHAGVYQLKISHSDGTAERKFNVTVYESASDPGESEMKSVSVKEGDRVTLQTGVIPLSGDELIVWRFGDEGKVIAKADIEAKSSPLYYDERFGDRLELDQTGSLIITNTRSTDSGFYTVKISSSTQTVYKRFTVTVSVIEPGLSPGGKAGIVLVFLAAVVAAAAAGFIYYRRKISELRKQTLTVTRTEGEEFILKPNKTIQKGDVMQWMFGDEEQQTSIAKFIGETGEIYDDDAANRIFKGRLKLDTTGSLTIRNSRTTHSGLYTLYITSSSGDSQQRFIVTVKERVEEKSVKDGDTVTLKPDTEIQRDEEMLWMFGEEYVLIAQIRGGTGEICDDDAAAGRFRGRLKLEKTGSLTITNIKPEHTGPYTLQISSRSSSRGTLFKRFLVYIPLTVSVTVTRKEREDVTLKPNKEIQKETLEEISVEDGGTVTLNPDTEIQEDEQIQWMFGKQDVLIAQIRGGTGKICIYDDAADGIFRGRLKLEKTGSLTITNITAADTGPYTLQISSRSSSRSSSTTSRSSSTTSRSSSRRILCKRFRVSIPLKRVYVTEGESVHLSTDRPEIERDDEIQWRCGGEIIAEIKEGTGETHDGADGRFRDRLQLDDQTGDLTIKNSTAEDAGDYKLKIRSSKGNRNWTYSVIFTYKATGKPLMKGNNGKRVDESVVEMQPLMIK